MHLLRPRPALGDGPARDHVPQLPLRVGHVGHHPEHFAAYAKDVAERFVPKGGLVVEIGSNDGTLLRAFDRGTVRILGVEPARNIAAMANAAGIPTLDEFFGEAIAGEIAVKHGRAAAIIGNNVVAHIDDLDGLMSGVTALLEDRGVFVAEFPYLVNLLEKTAYDTIYHEHLSYFSVASVDDLASRHGLRLTDVRRVGVHGGSIRVFISRHGEASAEVKNLLALEEKSGLRAGRPLRPFVEAVRRQRDDSCAFSERSVRRGTRRLRRACEGQHPAQLLRDRPIRPRFHCGPEPPEARSTYTRDPYPGRAT